MSTEGHKTYKYNFLTNVICRLNFPNIELNAETPPIELIEGLKEKFPKHRQIEGRSVELQIKDFEHTTTQENLVALEFTDEDNKNRVMITHDSLAFEQFEYKGFNKFDKNIRFIIEKFRDSYPLEKINRLGLRYVNQIEIKPPKLPLNWENLIKSELTCISDNFIEDNTQLSRSLNFIEINGEDYSLRFQSGLYNSEYPNPISKKEFVLDYDCVSIGELSLNDIVETTKKFHSIIYKWFEMSIDDELREMMSDES